METTSFLEKVQWKETLKSFILVTTPSITALSPLTSFQKVTVVAFSLYVVPHPFRGVLRMMWDEDTVALHDENFRCRRLGSCLPKCVRISLTSMTFSSQATETPGSEERRLASLNTVHEPIRSSTQLCLYKTGTSYPGREPVEHCGKNPQYWRKIGKNQCLYIICGNFSSEYAWSFATKHPCGEGQGAFDAKWINH